MTVPSETNRIGYVGAGTVGPFAIPFYFLENDDLLVYKTPIATGVGAPLTLNVDYTLTGAADPNGGTLTLTLAIDNTYQIQIIRSPDKLQNAQYPANDKFPSTSHQRVVDKLTMLVQRVYDVIARSPSLPDGDISGANMTLPTPVANSLWGWNATANGIANFVSAGLLAVSAFGQTLLNAANAAAARTLLGLASWIVAQTDTAFTTAGAAPNFTLTPTTALGAYVAGTRYRVKFHAVGAGADQMNISGLGNKAIKQYDYTGSKVQAVIRANLLTDIEYDGVDLVILDPCVAYSPGFGQTLLNGVLNESHAGNAATFAIKGMDGADPSAANPVYAVIRDVTVTVAAYTLLVITAACGITMSSGSTGGASNGVPFKPWFTLFNDAGTPRLAYINCYNGTDIYPLAQFGIASSTAEGGLGAADSAHVFYSTVAVAAKPYGIVGNFPYETGLAAAGTWNASPTKVQMYMPGVPLPNTPIQSKYLSTGAVATGATATPQDDTIPQITEGDQYMALPAITATSTAHVLEVEAQDVFGTNAAGDTSIHALHQDAIANALAAWEIRHDNTNVVTTGRYSWRLLAAIATAITFRWRVGTTNAATLTFNGFGGARKLGSAMGSWFKVTEIAT